MHLLMLSWEFPPIVVGGIARHVHDLSRALADEGHRVSVLTAGGAGAPPMEEHGNLHIHRVPAGHPKPLDFVGQIMQLNLNLLQGALALAADGERFDLVHAHDWVTAYAGKAVKHGLRIPLLATVHATEWGRNNGLHNDLQRYISDIEWWLCYEAWRVICCSRFMAGELERVFQLPADKIRVIPNGVYPEHFAADAVPPGFRERYAAADERIVLHIGRLVREKGLDVLLQAFRRVLEREPRTKLIIAGRGGHEGALRDHARRLGIEERVYFTGYIDDQTRNRLYRLADAAVFPSLYEPFGIVALEAMAAGAPLIVSDTGGISEVVAHGRNGLKAATGDPASLAENLLWLLNHPESAEGFRRQGRRDVRELYAWGDIARRTAQVCREVLAEAEGRREDAPRPAAPSERREEEYDRYSREMPACSL